VDRAHLAGTSARYEALTSLFSLQRTYAAWHGQGGCGFWASLHRKTRFFVSEGREGPRLRLGR
jgi:hypothetical protein